MDKFINVKDSYFIMNDYVIDLTIYNIKESNHWTDSFLPYQTLFIQIDVRGNVKIQKQSVYKNWILPECCVPHRRGKLIDESTIFTEDSMAGPTFSGYSWSVKSSNVDAIVVTCCVRCSR